MRVYVRELRILEAAKLLNMLNAANFKSSFQRSINSIEEE